MISFRSRNRLPRFSHMPVEHIRPSGRGKVDTSTQEKGQETRKADAKSGTMAKAVIGQEACLAVKVE